MTQPQQPRTGRPTLYSEALVQTLLDNITQGLPLRAACVYAGISYQTYLNWLELSEAGDERFLDFFDRVTHARRERARTLLQHANKIAETDGRIAIRLLELADPENFAPTTRLQVEHGGEVKHTHHLPAIAPREYVQGLLDYTRTGDEDDQIGDPIDFTETGPDDHPNAEDQQPPA